MIHRSVIRLTAGALGIVTLSSCATFSDDNLAARVGDVELTQDDLERLLLDKAAADAVAAGTQPSSIPPNRVPTTEAAGLITTFVINEALRNDLASLGSPLTDSGGDLSYSDLQASFGDAFTAWQGVPALELSDQQLREFYEQGPEGSQVTCTAHILVETEAAANQVLNDLRAGLDFAELAAASSIDPGSALQGGVLPCDLTSNFSSAYIPEYVEATLGAEVGTPVGPIQSQFGYHVILVRPFETISPSEIQPLLAEPVIRFGIIADDLDIYVNPRYGAFEPSAGVVPLG